MIIVNGIENSNINAYGFKGMRFGGWRLFELNKDVGGAEVLGEVREKIWAFGVNLVGII